MTRIALSISFLLLLMACEGGKSSLSEKAKVIQNEKKEVARPIEAKYIGTFSAGVETEATTTGMASIHYTFTITNESVQLETNTYHEPIRCNGKYNAVENNHMLELYYTGEDEVCDTEYPMFTIKEEKGNLYIQGLGSEATSSDWFKLKRE